jgi:hypothetical protein
MDDVFIARESHHPTQLRQALEESDPLGTQGKDGFVIHLAVEGFKFSDIHGPGNINQPCLGVFLFITIQAILQKQCGHYRLLKRRGDEA